jgi:hypothetical protein|tara:strand:+ start:2061 stop:2549 length:489 start_codon:yes stop_codon:yes gene_type:complete
MKIARLDGSTIAEIAEHKSLFPNTSFPKAGPDSDWLAANSCAEVVVFLAYDSATQKNESVTPYLSDGKVYTRRVTDMTSDEQAAVVTASNAATATRNRAERDKRLASCDWVVTKALEGGGAVPSDWATYRTALRNITTHANWPNLNYPNMDGSGGDWPVEPS